MEPYLCVKCFVHGDLHLVEVEEKCQETFLRQSKLHCDEKLEKVFSESSQVFVHATCRRDYTNYRSIAPTGAAPANKKIKLRSLVRSVTFLFTFTYIYTQMKVFAKIVSGFKPLAIPAKVGCLTSWVFDIALNTPLVMFQICKLGLKTRIYMYYYVRTCTQFKQILIHNIQSNSIRCMLQTATVLKIKILIETWPVHKTILGFCCCHFSKIIQQLLDAGFSDN